MYDELLAQLKNLRERREELKAETNAMIDSVTSSPNYVAADTELKNISGAIGELESQIRLTAITEFNTTGNKNVHPQVTVKIFKNFVVLSAPTVLAWVKSNLADALVYDTKKVENYAKKIGPVDGTALVDEPRAQIAQEL